MVDRVLGLEDNTVSNARVGGDRYSILGVEEQGMLLKFINELGRSLLSFL